MRRMDTVKSRGRGRPRKCPRREVFEAEESNEINFGHDTTNTATVGNGNDDNIASAQAFEGSASFATGTVTVEAAVIAPLLVSPVASNLHTLIDGPVVRNLTDVADGDVPTDDPAPVEAPVPNAPALAVVSAQTDATVPADASAPTDTCAAADAGNGLPSARIVKPRRRPRKSTPRRSPFY